MYSFITIFESLAASQIKRISDLLTPEEKSSKELMSKGMGSQQL